jgi:hypothetical protein
MLRLETFHGTLDEWAELAATFPGYDVFQTPAWMHFLTESQGVTPVTATLHDGEGIAGCFAGMLVRWHGIRILGSPFTGWTTESMGIRLCGRVRKRDAVRALADYAFGELRCLHLEFRDPNFVPADVDGLGFNSTVSGGYILDLNQDEAQILQGFSQKSCRYSIRKAEKLGVVIEEAGADGFAGEYYSQLLEVFAKQSLVPTYNQRRVELLIKHMLPTGNLLLLRARDPDGRPIATGLFLGMNRTSYFWGNASCRDAQHLCPNEALHWYAIRYWKRRGFHYYDLCGGGDYKKKYGGFVATRYWFRQSKYLWVSAGRRSAYRLFRWRQTLKGRRASGQSPWWTLPGLRRRRQPAPQAPAAKAAQAKTKRTRIRIEPYTDAHVPAVQDFNARMRSGGTGAHFPLSPISSWLPKMPGRPVFQEYFLAIDDRDVVRGAYILKHRQFTVRGNVNPMSVYQLPISEGLVNRLYSPVGAQLLRDALQREPLLLALGMGGWTGPLPRLLKVARWDMFAVPFYFRVVHPRPFFRNLVRLRKKAGWRWMLDLMAATGLGWLGTTVCQNWRGRWPRPDPNLAVDSVAEFSSWADEVWEAAKDQYGLSGVRDAANLRTLYPVEERRFLRLKFSQGGRTVGWAVVLNTKLESHNHFGNMQLGTIVDGFAAVADVPRIVSTAAACLRSLGADLIVSNQCHYAWCRGLRQAGFVRGPSNVVYAGSRSVTDVLQRNAVQYHDLHLNRGDGDGPMNL